MGASLAGMGTVMQVDIKKLVAYRRVTHITFIVVGLLRGGKLYAFRALLLSVIHGWAAILLFYVRGILSQGAVTRLLPYLRWTWFYN